MPHPRGKLRKPGDRRNCPKARSHVRKNSMLPDAARTVPSVPVGFRPVRVPPLVPYEKVALSGSPVACPPGSRNGVRLHARRLDAAKTVYARHHFHIRGSKLNSAGSENSRSLKSECAGLMSKLNSSGTTAEGAKRQTDEAETSHLSPTTQSS